MKLRGTLILAACIGCLVPLSTRQTLLAQQAPAPPQTSEPVPIQPRSKDILNEDLQRLTNQVLQLQLDAEKASKPPKSSDLGPAIIAGSVTLAIALISLFGQFNMSKFTAKHAVELARHEAAFQNTEKILEFRLKQIELFYAPMFALLEQSRGLYDKMLYQLVQDQPEEYKWPSEPNPEDDRLHVRAKDGTWKSFRLLDQLPAIRAAKDTKPTAFALVEQILEIGAQITKIISEHTGLASEDLIDSLGEYLAHYAILSDIHKRGETKPYESGWHKIGYYPRELNKKVAVGHHDLNRLVEKYAKMLEVLPQKKDDKEV